MPEELQITEHQSALEAFYASVTIKCNKWATVKDFYDLGAAETPEYDIYKYDTTDGARSNATPKELEPTPYDAPYHYLNASVVLTLGNKFSWGKVIGCKRDSEGNPIGRSNAQTVLCIRCYAVDFGDGEITELTENVIAESMYAQLNSEGNDKFYDEH